MLINIKTCIILAYVANENPRNSGPLEADASDDRFPSSKDIVPVFVSVSYSTTQCSVFECYGARQKLKRFFFSFRRFPKKDLFKKKAKQKRHPASIIHSMDFTSLTLECDLLAKGGGRRNCFVVKNDQCVCVSFSKKNCLKQTSRPLTHFALPRPGQQTNHQILSFPVSLLFSLSLSFIFCL